MLNVPIGHGSKRNAGPLGQVPSRRATNPRGMDGVDEGPWLGTEAAQRLPAGGRALVVLLATVPALGIGIVLLVAFGLKTILIDVGLRQPDVQVPVLAWLSPCGRTLVTGSPAATVSVERGHHPHEPLQQDGRGFPLNNRDNQGGGGGTCSATIDSTPMPDFIPHEPLSMLGPVQIDLPGGKSVSKFTDSGSVGRTMFLAIDTTASSTAALEAVDLQLRAVGYSPAPGADGVTTYNGDEGTVSVHIARTRGRTVTVVVAQHAPPLGAA